MKQIDFKIEHIDILGQGVSKIGDKITFLPKTLPDEQGICQITKEVKGVAFAQLLSIEDIKIQSQDRITPICPHFYQCGGCDFLHTNYKNEITFKRSNLERLLQKIKSFKNEMLQVHPALQRTSYRSKIQLHYNKSKNQIGLLSANSSNICNISNCQIALPEITNFFKKIYQSSNFWIDLVKKHPNKGHIEISSMESNLKILPNKNYSHGGFQQINRMMNKKLVEIVTKEIEIDQTHDFKSLILDLFGGNGNLTQDTQGKNILGIDLQVDTKKDSNHNYLKLDLYKNNALNLLLKKIKGNFVKTLILDPPRSGFSNLNVYTKKLLPEKIIYVSCQVQTLIRDITPLLTKSYYIKAVHLIDMFPSTKHFETIFILHKLNS